MGWGEVGAYRGVMSQEPDLGPETPGRGDWSATSAAAAAAACAAAAAVGGVGAAGLGAGKGVWARGQEAAAVHTHLDRRLLLTMRRMDTSERLPVDSRRSRVEASAAVIGSIEENS